MRTTHMLHCRRNTDEPATATEKALAAEIAENVLQAFGKAPERHPDIQLGWQIEGCPARRTGAPATDKIAFPAESDSSFSITRQCCTDHAVMNSIVAAEIAVEWRDANLIDGYCDRFRWGRHLYDDSYRPTIEAALRALAVPFTDGNTTEFTEGPDQICPDADGLRIAARLAEQLTALDASVVLFGSRATGKQTDESDVDLMVFQRQLGRNDPPQEGQEPFPMLRNAVAEFIRTQRSIEQGTEIDVNIVEQAKPTYYAHHSQNLQQPLPNGLLLRGTTGITDQYGIETREFRPDLSAHPVHFLSPELWVTKVLDDGCGSFGTLELVDMPGCRACR